MTAARTRGGGTLGNRSHMSDLRKIIIDDTEIEVDPAMTLIQACEQAGIEIPRFCYHERLSIAGNCRMCLVEIEGQMKAVPARERRRQEIVHDRKYR